VPAGVVEQVGFRDGDEVAELPVRDGDAERIEGFARGADEVRCFGVAEFYVRWLVRWCWTMGWGEGCAYGMWSMAMLLLVLGVRWCEGKE